MNQNWRTAVIRRLVFSLGICLSLGFLTDAVWFWLAMGAGAYLFWNLRQMFLLGKWLHNYASAIHDEPPSSYGLWGEIFDNIYRLMRLQERSRNRLKAVIGRFQESTGALSDAIVMTNSQGQIEWWNPAAEHMLGFRDPHDRGQSVTNLLRHPRFISYFEQKSYQEPLSLPSPISSERNYIYSITLYGPDNRMIVVRDNSRIHQLEQMRKDFVANVSHELRTPLTVIAGYLETLSDNASMMPSGVPAPFVRAFGQMQTQADRMENIIEDLLMLSKLETDDTQQSIQPVALKPMLERIIEDAHSLSGNRKHDIKFRCGPEDIVLGNEKELRSAISNLIFNAVKYTPEKGQITVKWVVELNTGYLTVKDNGIGIDPQHIPRLTERFYRVDKSRHSDTGGTGLGLAIVKHVLLRHDATLLIRSRPGRGSSFVCQFPRNRLVRDAA